MRLHTDTIETANELHSLLPDGVYAYITPKGSRKRARAFEVTLYVPCKDELHRRVGNSGGYGSSEDVAATWDEWGIWMERIYALDPEALVGWYADYADFLAQTARQVAYEAIAHKPESLSARTHTAPWLKRARLEEIRVELRAERISYGELIELQGLVEYIEPGDVELLEAAGVPEFEVVGSLTYDAETDSLT